jgi:hypothetical protein
VRHVDQLHALLAWVAVAGTLALLGAAILTATGRVSSHLLLDRAILVQIGTMAVAVLSGLAAPIAGRLPADPLHFLYAIVGLVVAPGIRAWTRSADDRRQGRWQVVAAAVALGAVLRLFMTGR